MTFFTHVGYSTLEDSNVCDKIVIGIRDDATRKKIVKPEA